MDIERSFQILELEPRASLDEARQAYKDIVSVWHPDRFSHNPRLKRKAEKKIKEINAAYEEITLFLGSKEKKDRNPGDERSDSHNRDRTEAAVEAGTRIVLTLCSAAYKKLRHWVESQAPESEARTTSEGDKGKVEPDRKQRD
jgi:DnaJ-class molecular chaperone